jgi:hypothetical protein
MDVVTTPATNSAATADKGSAGGIRFTVASRPQARVSNTQTVSNLAGATSFQPIQLPATGWVRKLALLFTASVTSASAGAVVAGDGPWNLISGITLTDATGQPIFQPISGYNLYLKNKYSSTGTMNNTNMSRAWADPQLGPEYAFASTSTVGTATFRLDIDLEQDYNTGYGCIPNLDSNASLQLKIDVAASTVAFSGTTTSAATVSVRVGQHYWAPVGATVGGVPAMTNPVGFGDYLETRYETQTVTAAAENTVNVTNRGGLVKNIIVVSRAAGVRTAFTAGANVGLILDNNPIFEGILLSEWQDILRRTYGYIGTDLSTSYAPLTAGTLPGLDNGVLCWPFHSLSGGRDSWLNTRVGSLLQLKLTPGASATTLEIITELAQIKDASAFYNPSAID